MCVGFGCSTLLVVVPFVVPPNDWGRISIFASERVFLLRFVTDDSSRDLYGHRCIKCQGLRVCVRECTDTCFENIHLVLNSVSNMFAEVILRESNISIPLS